VVSGSNGFGNYLTIIKKFLKIESRNCIIHSEKIFFFLLGVFPLSDNSIFFLLILRMLILSSRTYMDIAIIHKIFMILSKFKLHPFAIVFDNCATCKKHGYERIYSITK